MKMTKQKKTKAREWIVSVRDGCIFDSFGSVKDAREYYECRRDNRAYEYVKVREVLKRRKGKV